MRKISITGVKVARTTTVPFTAVPQPVLVPLTSKPVVATVCPKKRKINLYSDLACKKKKGKASGSDVLAIENQIDGVLWVRRCSDNVFAFIKLADVTHCRKPCF